MEGLNALGCRLPDTPKWYWLRILLLHGEDAEDLLAVGEVDNTSSRAVPSSSSSSQTEETTSAGESNDMGEIADRQADECDEEDAEGEGKAVVDLGNCEKHVSSEDRPAEQEDADTLCLEAGINVFSKFCAGLEVPEGHPESTVGCKRGSAEEVVLEVFHYASDDLGDATVEEGKAEYDGYCLGIKKASIEYAEHEGGQCECGEAKGAGIGNLQCGCGRRLMSCHCVGSPFDSARALKRGEFRVFPEPTV